MAGLYLTINGDSLMKHKLLSLAIFSMVLPLFYNTVLEAGNCKKKCGEWDYIIVGDGTAGAVLAAQLSNNHKNRVLVLEWGENRTDDPLVLSPNVFDPNAPQLTNSPVYANTNEVIIQFPGQPSQTFTYSDGRMWGGSSAHNGLFAVRGTPNLYDFWAAKTGKNRWKYSNLLPLMKQMENYTPDGTVANPNQRGFSGPLSITQSPPVNTDPFAIATALGTNAPLISDYNDPSLGNIGVSAHQQWITAGSGSHRSFSANSYQVTGTVVNEDGDGLCGRKLRVKSNCLVEKVIIKNRKAVGVQYWQDGNHASVRKAYAKKKVILCAGTIQSSAILERSGIGDPAILEPLGIKVIVNNPNVGANVTNQYGVGGVILGSTSATPFLTGFINGSPFMPNDNVRRLQLIGINEPNVVVLSGVLLDPQSKGTTHISSSDPTKGSIVNLNMFSDGSVTDVGSDSYILVSFYKILQTIAANYGTSVVAPSPAVYAAGDDALLSYAQTLSDGSLTITYHMVGSARMSDSMVDGVVNGSLHVFGVKNLMVADCSIEPLSQDGNTAYGAYVIGLVTANILE